MRQMNFAARGAAVEQYVGNSPKVVAVGTAWHYKSADKKSSGRNKLRQVDVARVAADLLRRIAAGVTAVCDEETSMFNKVVLADNQMVFRTGAARIMALQDDIRIVGQCEDAARLVKTMEGAPRAIAVVGSSVNIDMAGVLKAVREVSGKLVMVLENFQHPEEYVQAGVDGIVHRDVLHEELVRCIRRVGGGERYFQKRAGADASEADGVAERVRDKLTTKELKVLGLVLRGYKNREIASELNNSEQVIKNYLRSIFDKTGVSDRLELALFTIHHRPLASAAYRANGEVSGNQQMVAVSSFFSAYSM